MRTAFIVQRWPFAGLLLLAVIVMLSGCSGGPPSESMGQKVLEHQVEGQSKGKIKLVGFKKTNGMGDSAYYQVVYEAEIEFRGNGAWLANSGSPDSPSFEFSEQQMGGGGMEGLMGPLLGANNVRQGQRTTVKGALRFQKTEKGWLGQDGQVY